MEEQFHNVNNTGKELMRIKKRKKSSGPKRKMI
jgi:hypothetical protein